MGQTRVTPRVGGAVTQTASTCTCQEPAESMGEGWHGRGPPTGSAATTTSQSAVSQRLSEEKVAFFGTRSARLPVSVAAQASPGNCTTVGTFAHPT